MCSNCEPSTNRTLTSCTLLASLLYVSKNLRKRKKKVTCPSHKVGRLAEQEAELRSAICKTHNSTHRASWYPRPQKTSVPQTSGCSPDRIPRVTQGCLGSPALGYVPRHHFHWTESQIISPVWPLAPDDYLLSD